MQKIVVLILGILYLSSVDGGKAIANSIPNSPVLSSQDAKSLEQEAQKLYQNGLYDQVIPFLQQAIANYVQQGDLIGEVVAQRNLGLVYQRQGDWQQASQVLSKSLNQINKIADKRQRQQFLAQTWEVQGQLQLSMGNSQAALETWKQATEAYEQLGDSTGTIRGKINQAQALQALGLYNQAIKTLTVTEQSLDQQPDSLLKAKALQSLGDVLRGIGRLEESTQVLTKSLAIAQKLSSPAATTETLLSLGKTTRLQNAFPQALEYYQAAAKQAPTADLQIQAFLNQLELLLDQKQADAAQLLIPQIEKTLTQLPNTRTAVYSRITFGQLFLKPENKQYYSQSLLAQKLATAVQLAQQLGDKRAESFAKGVLGKLYEQNQRYPQAKKLTEEALLIAQANNTSDLSYQWQWQLGRILKAQGEDKSAIAAYSQSVKTLKSLRTDLVAIDSNIQFSFRESVEPVYRELVTLLLQKNPGQNELKQARDVIESLQLAELDNFFRNACLDAKPVQIDKLDPTSAIFYPIILKDTLEVIVALPNQPLRHYTTNLTQSEIDRNINQLRGTLASPRERVFNQKRLKISQQIYNWLISPVESDLQKNNIKNLVFIPDGALRNIPVSILYDGNQYLIEKYSIAIAPSLQLIDPKALVREDIQILGGGMSEARQGFPALPNVLNELQQIQSEIPSSVLLKNESFTDLKLEQKVKETSYQIVHLATHGEFSSQAAGTFVLTWDNKLNVDQLNEILRSDTNQLRPIELLVLSACRTAAGDNRAALGLAGMAVRAGARSTIASLWYVNDEATTLLMSQFYQELTNSKLTKAEALRNAQIAIFKNPKFAHPYYWSAFVIVGNWL
ncbi:hypothetical protein B6N60_01275 [Richelia sinica FACHB-800]|uniref:CHAT domain-containing protein n=1 Tax=Richelia sinica FACHB-800 TaxID=1357546 RepID=A0A975T6X7_9NOST|nr:CHAT domain-containing protein [Richelia sinica]MBD2664191.1 CHAT domain-containing protein [Richelia sinica FACHB-800]QXE22592.1 hypothetical protein B6N60_01275 [Richelia sinica FACHB-800]